MGHYLSLTTGLTDGYREHSKQASFRIFSNAGYRPREEVETRFYFTYVLTDSELPGALTKQQLEQDPRQAAQTNVINNWKRDFYLVRLANKTVWQQGDHRIESTAFWSYKDLHHPIFVVTIEAGTREQAGRVEWDLAYYFSWLEDELIEYRGDPGIDEDRQCRAHRPSGHRVRTSYRCLSRNLLPSTVTGLLTKRRRQVR